MGYALFRDILWSNTPGRSIEEWLAIPDKGRERVEEVRGPHAAESKVYVIWIEAHCRVFWTVNTEGIITGWRSEGSACKHYWQ